MNLAMFVLAAQGAGLPEWLLRLLSVDTERVRGGAGHFRFARFPEGGLGLVALLALVAGFVLIFWNYRREGQLSRFRKILLAGLRSLVLLVAALVLFYPVLEVDRAQELRATTILLVDDSSSQAIRDRYQGDVPRRDALAKELGIQVEEVAAATRAELVEKALSRDDFRWLRLLSSANKLKAYGFSGLPLEPILLEEAGSSTLKLARLAPTGTVTDISGALRSAVEEQGGARVAGIVLVTDGRVTAGEDLSGAAGFLKERQVPVHAVGVGDPTPIQNLRVTTVLASERVFAGDPALVDVRLDQHGFDGEAVSVELEDTFQPSGEPARAPVKVEAQTVTFQEGRSDGAASFRFELQGIGLHRLTARVETRPQETFADDNERSASMEVVKEASKVLIVAGGPSYEYRFLKNLLRRDARVLLSAWLMSADPDYPQEGDVSIQKLPRTAKELFEYDVVILMDVDPEGLPEGFPVLLEEFVGKHRGGLCCIPGEKYAASFFEARSMAPVRDMLPVLVDAPEVRDEIGKGKFYERQWPLEPTPAALDHPATRLSSQMDRNLQRWAEIAGIYWSFPARKAKPGATVLFVHPDPGLAREGQPRPLVATQFYQGGRVAWCGIDSTWMWRATAESVYDRFWIQLVRYLTEGRLGGDRRRLVQTDRETYELGDALRISVLVEDENYRPLEAPEQALLVEAPDGAQAEVRLEKDAVSPGWFRGLYVPRALGAYKLRIPGGPDKSIRVEAPALEFEEPRLDEDALRQLAERTGGSYVPLAEIRSVPGRIPDRRQTVTTTDEPIPLWDNWLSMGLLAGLLAIEWILRKVSRLP